MVGRPRPDWKTGTPSFSFHPCKGGLPGLFSQETLGFPSGDVALAVSSAAVLGYLIPRWRIAWWTMALIVAFQRVAESSHHLSDVFAAAALGLLAFHCARVACRLSPDSIKVPSGPFSDLRRTVATLPSSMELKPYLSLVIPSSNEAENVPTLLTRVEAALALTDKPFDVVIVDDGSTDSTPRRLT